MGIDNINNYNKNDDISIINSINNKTFNVRRQNANKIQLFDS